MLLIDEKEFAKKEGKELISCLRKEIGYIYPLGISLELLIVIESLCSLCQNCGFCSEGEEKTYLP